MWIDLLNVIVVGFLAVTPTHLARVSIFRLAGYIPFFAVLVAGAFGLWIGEMIVDLSELVFTKGTASSGVVEEGKKETVLPLDLIAAFAVVIAASVVLNRSFPLAEVYRFAAQLESNLLELLLQEGVENQFLVELTMENGKVYIGHPYDSGIHAPGEGDVSVIPFISFHHSGEAYPMLTLQLKNDAFIPGCSTHFVGRAA